MRHGEEVSRTPRNDGIAEMSDRDEETPRPDEPGKAGEAAAIDPRLLEILVCPQTHTALEWDAARGELISRAAKLAYPVRDGIPIMLVEEARRLDEE